jgi:hypothetical protein
LAAADVDGNGLDDLVVAGTYYSPTVIFLQQANGKFEQRLLTSENVFQNSKEEGILIFDANGDSKPDIYIASGGYKDENEITNYQDKLFLNDGKGNFTAVTDALPVNSASKFCVRAMDYNNDGKLDLFVSGRVDQGKYPKPVSSFIFRNDTENGKVKFTDLTSEIAPDLLNIGMVCDALFTDFNNDNKIDLILAGEWMPVTFLQNTGGKFKNVTAETGVSGKTGWWNSIVAGDFRHTGKTDYIIGNTGLNTLYQASEEYPVKMIAKDFDKNGSYVPIPSLYLPAVDGKLKEFPAFGRDDIIERIPTLKKRFDNYGKFADADMDKIFPAEMRKDAQQLKATMLQSCFLRNDGNGKFTMIPLPEMAQISALNGMLTDDYDGDGKLDVLINGNDFGPEVSIGRMDALNGIITEGDDKGGFKPLSILESGIYIPGDGKALVKLKSSQGDYLVAASQNRDKLKLFGMQGNRHFLTIKPDDVSAVFHLKDGRVQKEEFYYGQGFLSQSSRDCIICPDDALNVSITNSKGVSRAVVLN